MTNEKRKLTQGSDTSYRGGSGELSSDMQHLLDRAPQFGKLAEAAKGQVPELSPSQQEFLRKFANQLATGITQDNSGSAPRASRKPAKPGGMRTSTKGG